MSYPGFDLTPEQRAILSDRARKHKALLHNQPHFASTTDGQDRMRDTRVEESEVILDTLLRLYSLISGDEQIEEIAAVEATDEPWDQTPAHLCITTNLQILEIPYRA